MNRAPVLYKKISTPLGSLFLAASSDAMVRTSYNESISSLLLELKKLGYQPYKYESRELSAAAGKAARLLDNAQRQIELYFKGNLAALDKLPVNAHGTDFQREVWSALKKIPAGTTKYYEELAEKIGRENASRAVGTACKHNPLVLLVPCHRVIGKNRSLSGFRAGINRKASLLKHEGSVI